MGRHLLNPFTSQRARVLPSLVEPQLDFYKSTCGFELREDFAATCLRASFAFAPMSNPRNAQETEENTRRGQEMLEGKSGKVLAYPGSGGAW